MVPISAIIFALPVGYLPESEQLCTPDIIMHTKHTGRTDE